MMLERTKRGVYSTNPKFFRTLTYFQVTIIKSKCVSISLERKEKDWWGPNQKDLGWVLFLDLV